MRSLSKCPTKGEEEVATKMSKVWKRDTKYASIKAFERSSSSAMDYVRRLVFQSV
jgi:hypothetical protein